MTQKGSLIIKSTAIVTVMTIACKVLGFAEKQFLAHYCGTETEADAYMLALTIPIMIYVCVDQLLRASFLSVFKEASLKSTKEEAWRFSSILFNLLVIILFVVAGSGIFFSPSLVRIFAPGFEGERHQMAARLTRLMIPAGLFLGLSSLTALLLQSRKHFFVPAFGQVLNKVGIILCLVLLYGVMGITGIAVGVVAGGGLCLLVQLLALRKDVGLYRPEIDLGHPSLGELMKLMLPITIGLAFSQLSGIVGNVFASMLPTGSLSALGYARRIVDLPILAIGYALGIVLLPYFVDVADREDKNELADLFTQSIRWIILIFLPIGILTIILRWPIVQLLFQHGKFDEESSRLTVQPLTFYALGMLSLGLEIIIMRCYFSMKDTFTPIVVGICCVCLNLALTAILVRIFDHGGIALAFTCSKSIKILILLIFIRKRLPDFHGWRGNAGFLIRTAIAAGAMTLAAFGGLAVIQNVFESDGGKWAYLTILGITGLCGAFVFAGMAWILRIEETRQVWAQVCRSVRHRQQPPQI